MSDLTPAGQSYLHRIIRWLADEGVVQWNEADLAEEHSRLLAVEDAVRRDERIRLYNSIQDIDLTAVLESESPEIPGRRRIHATPVRVFRESVYDVLRDKP